MDRIINNIKALGIDMIHEANSGHPGIVLGAAPIIYTLYKNHLNINVNDPKWLNRDRFVMSAGHGSALLYATLYMVGFLELEDLKKFRKIGSKTPGHPEVNVTPGVDITTGPLGQGISSAVGMAIAEKKLNELTKFPNGESLIDHKIYVLCGDGDLMEGVTSEAASLAGILKLNNLIVLYDSNNVCLDSQTNTTFNENICSKFEAMGWNAIYVKNGEDVKAIDKAISKAKKSDKPTIIEIKTIIGRDSLLEGTNTIHGKPLSDDDIKQLKNKLNVSDIPFYFDLKEKENFQKEVFERSKIKYDKWAEHYKEYKDGNLKNSNLFNFIFEEEKIDNIDLEEYENIKDATRFTNRKVITEISKKMNFFIGGSADLSGPTGSFIDNEKVITSTDFSGKNIFFGVREHAMGAILNGLALYGFRPFGSTFLSFSDYLKPAIRMSSLMNLPVTYIFSHDSINIGEDGPTHQPIEQLVSLRAIPNMDVYRPCDVNELIGCWNEIIKRNKPASLILSRIESPVIGSKNVSRGGYILDDSDNFKAIIIATGTDVVTAYNLKQDLKLNHNIEVRVVSMPNRELFLKQDNSYQEEVLPKGYKKFVIEAGSKFGWEGFVYSDKYLFTLDKFGISGKKDDVLKYMNFDYETIKKQILEML